MAKKRPQEEEQDSTQDARRPEAESGSGSGSGESAGDSDEGIEDAPTAKVKGIEDEPTAKVKQIEDEPTQKLRAVSKKEAAAAAALTKKGALKETKAVPAPGQRRVAGAMVVPIICSECHGEGTDFVFDTGVPSDSLTCPICEHQAARPNDADIARIAEKRGTEKKNFIISLSLALVGLLAFFIWAMVCRNPHTNAQEAGGLFYGPVAVASLCALGCLVFTCAKYEGNRHDVYF